MQSLHLFLTGKKLSTDLAIEYIEAAEGCESLERDGATFSSVIKALRKLGAKFKAKTLGKLTSTKSLEMRMVLVADDESYDQLHAVVLYRENGTIWLFDCLCLTGAYQITEERALRLIARSDETYRVERR